MTGSQDHTFFVFSILRGDPNKECTPKKEIKGYDIMKRGVIWELFVAVSPREFDYYSMYGASHIFYAALLSMFVQLSRYEATLIVCMNSRSKQPDSPLKILSFCKDCPSPEIEGSIATGLVPKHGVVDYFITGEVVYCIPNFAEKAKILNKHQFPDRIVFVNRGQTPLLEKVIRIQHSGAAAVIIADDGQCDDAFVFCGVRAGSVNEGGFAASDEVMRWSEVTIPVLLVSQTTAERLRSLMQLEYMKITKLGMQNVTILRNSINGAVEL